MYMKWMCICALYVFLFTPQCVGMMDKFSSPVCVERFLKLNEDENH